MADDKKQIWVIPVFVRKEEEETQRKRAVQTKIKKVTALIYFINHPRNLPESSGANFLSPLLYKWATPFQFASDPFHRILIF